MSIIVRARSKHALCNQFLMFGLVFFTIMTPRDEMNLKIIFLGLTLLYNMRTIIKGLLRDRWMLLLAFAFPGFIFFLNVLFVENVGIAVTSTYIYTYLWLLPVIEKDGINLGKNVIFVTNVMCFIILGSAVLDMTGVMPIAGNPVLSWINAHQEGAISVSPNAMFYYVIFLKATPFMLYNLAHYLKKRNYPMAAAVFVALLFSGMRANIFCAVALTAVCLVLLEPRRDYRVLFSFVAVFVVLSCGSAFVGRVDVINAAKSAGDGIRVATVRDIGKLMARHPLYWLFGMGYGAPYYSTGRMKMVLTSEMSYFELLRTTGLPYTLAFLALLFKPMMSLWRNRESRFVLVFYLAYLAESFMEPYILTSTGLFAVLLVYYESHKARAQEDPFAGRKAAGMRGGVAAAARA